MSSALSPVVIVQTLTNEADFAARIPFPIKICLEGLKFFHQGWWWYRKQKLYTDQENFLALAGGHLLDLTIGNQIFRSAAKLLFIITRIEECWKQINLFINDFESLCHHFQGHYPEHIKPKWSRSTGDSFFSLSTQNAWVHRKKKIYSTTKRLSVAVLILFKRIGILSLHFWDAYDAFYVKNEAMHEVVVNGFKWCDKLKENKNRYIDLLNEKKPMIEKIFIDLNINLNVDNFIEESSKAIESAANVIEVLDSAKKVGNGIITDFFKRCTSNLFAEFNILDWLPESVLSHERAEWVTQALPSNSERYPQIQWKRLKPDLRPYITLEHSRT